MDQPRARLAHREDQKTCSARINIVHFDPPVGGLMRGARAPFRSRGSVRLREFKCELRCCSRVPLRPRTRGASQRAALNASNNNAQHIAERVEEPHRESGGARGASERDKVRARVYIRLPRLAAKGLRSFLTTSQSMT